MNNLKDSVMVQADLTDRELDLILYLVEQQIDSENSVSVDGVELFSEEELAQVWEKLSAAEYRMDEKLERLAQPRPKADGTAVDLWQDPQTSIWDWEGMA